MSTEIQPIVKDIVIAEEHPDLPEADIDELVKNFNADEHEPPVVIGHPKDDGPSYGWVKKIWKKGKEMWGHVSFLPEMVELIKKGALKNRSIALYTDFNGDGTGKKVLRHVGILGATPPRIKGMPAIEFGEHGEFKSVEFVEVPIRWDLEVAFDSIANIFTKLREYFIEKYGREEVDKIFENWNIYQIRSGVKYQKIDDRYLESTGEYSEPINSKSKEVKVPDDKKEVTYSEQQHQSILEAALGKQKKELEIHFSEKENTKEVQFSEEKVFLEAKIKEFSDKAESHEKTITALKEEIKNLHEEQVKMTVINHADGLIKEGKLKPADKEPLVKVYCEVGDEQRKMLIEMDKNRPKIIEFGEIPEASGEGERKTVTTSLTQEECEKYGITPEMEKMYGPWADKNTV